MPYGLPTKSPAGQVNTNVRSTSAPLATRTADCGWIDATGAAAAVVGNINTAANGSTGRNRANRRIAPLIGPPFDIRVVPPGARCPLRATQSEGAWSRRDTGLLRQPGSQGATIARREGRAMPQARVWERDATLAAIDRLLAEAREGQGRSLFIVGEAGLGKTTMAERARSEASGSFRVGVGRGDAAESTLPFGMIDQALRGLGFKIARKAGAPKTSGLEARAAQLYGALRFLEGLSSPTLLLLDDLHWADEDSLSLLSFLCRRIGGLPVAVLATLRPWPPAGLELARNMVNEGDASIELLQPLTDPSAQALLSDRAGRPISPSSARRASGLAAGNPLLLEEVAASLRRGKDLPELPGDAATAGPSLLRERFTGASAEERRYAQAASILGGHFRPSITAGLAELSSAAGDHALEALCRGGLFVSESPGRARFAHPLLRQVIYDDLPVPLRARWHARAFHLLVAAGADPSEAAEHASKADIGGDAEAVAVLTEAGRTAMRAGAIARARQRLQSAAAVAGVRAPPDLLMDLGEVLLDSGDGQKAVATYRRLLAMPGLPEGTRVAAQRMLGRALFIRGSVKDAGESFRVAVVSASP